MTIAFLFGGAAGTAGRRLPGSAILLGCQCDRHAERPGRRVGDFVWTRIIFGIAWAIGFGLGHKLREADEAKERAERDRARARAKKPSCGCRGAGADRPRAP